MTAGDARASGDYLLRLGEALRPLASPAVIQATASRVLRHYLGAERVSYTEAVAPDTLRVVATDQQAGVPSHFGNTYRISDFGPHMESEFKAGRLTWRNDVLSDPAYTDAERAQHAAVGAVAWANAPLVKGGRLVAMLTVQFAHPHRWTEAELAILGETAERTWAATEIATLFRRLISAQEAERRRLARDLHDHLGQQMTALRMNIETLRAPHAGEAEWLARVERIEQLAEELDRGIDAVAWDLRPVALDLGLAAALRTLVQGWSERFQVTGEFAQAGGDDRRLPEETAANLYRIAQEALHNIVKHAQASRASVMLDCRDAEARLVIEDDGRGFAPGQAAPEGGLGLVSMRERAAHLGGTLEVESAPGRGTTVFVRVPSPPRG